MLQLQARISATAACTKVRLQAVVKRQEECLGSVFAISTAASLTLGWHTLTILPPVIGDASLRGLRSKRDRLAMTRPKWPHHGVRSAMPGAAILYWLAGTRLRRTDRLFTLLQKPRKSFKLVARRSALKQHVSAVVVPRGCRWRISNWSEASRIWGTVAMSVQACENTDNATFSILSTEISVFLLASCGNDPPLHEILFAPLLARGVWLTVQDPGQRIAGCARPPMTKITAVAGLEGFLMERCKVPVYSLSVQCWGFNRRCFHSTANRYIIWQGLPCHSFFILSRSYSLTSPLFLSVVFLRYWSP